MPEENNQTRPFLLGLGLSILILISFFGGAIADRVFVIKPLDALIKRSDGFFSTNDSSSNSLLGQLSIPEGTQTVPQISEAASQSVVTVSIKKQQRVLEQVPGFFGFGIQVPNGRTEEIQQDIGTGFVVGEAGIIVTNRHVVSDPDAEYSVIDKNDKEHIVTQIYRDPTIDMAILKVEDLDAPVLPLGNSDAIKVGESVIAIGTALGEFRHTVTTGVVSGLGRAITAGDGLGGSIEALENVIQTDAAINPGNSGGPLLNASGQVIGVNVAVSANAQNVGFAIPINVIKASIENFNQTGKFERPFLGVSYRMITEQAALMNEVPQGAYVLGVQEGSTAAEAGIQEGDIITTFAGTVMKGDAQLAEIINSKKVGETIEIIYWRDGENKNVSVVLKSAE